jgi:ADP-ribosylglycohydrolase
MNPFQSEANEREAAIVGCLLGTAVGDSMGLPSEGLSKRRQRRRYPHINGHRFLFGRGMISDDTEHACMVAQSLITSAGDVQAFVRSLAWRFRFWLLGLPAGVGYATLKSMLKLWIGFSGRRSGVFSAGNGPAMRSAVIGSCYGHDDEKMRELVRASTRITHTDPKAEFGALAVALAAHAAGCGWGKEHHGEITPQSYGRTLQNLLGAEANEFLGLVDRAVESAAADQTTESFAEGMGLGRGVTGYVYHTVPVALHAWFRHPADYRSAVREVVRCGGDTDTTAAIVGGIVGARVGKAGIPAEWLGGLWEWPRSIAWIEALGKRLAEVVSRGEAQRALPLSPFGVFLRNIFFLVVVLAHGFRRLLPPY